MPTRSALQLDALLFDALAQPVAARPQFIRDACGSDTHLLQELEKLLRLHDRAGEFLERPAGVVLEEPGAEERGHPNDVGDQIGPYRLLERIGEGGFGTVFVAEQLEPVRRRVALKVIKPGMDTGQVIARFEVERQALAMMDHPNIARVLDAGSTELGHPYFVMELVHGVPITRFSDAESLTIRDRLALAVDVCQAVQHAHTKGIIHRDLKPSNILVSRHDDHPVVKVIDFGIAKATGDRLTDKTLYTEFRQLIGTPAYMSPEQAGFSDLDIDTRSDIYSLGVLLYELLTGTTPFDAETLARADFDELRRIIREQDPPKPSTRVGTAATGAFEQPAASLPSSPEAASTASKRPARQRQTTKTLARSLRGDLDWIVMKCLEKDRTRRYETAGALALDLQRFLKNEPVTAGPPSGLYRLRRTFRRYRLPISIVAAFLVVLTAATVISTVLWMRAADQAVQASTQRDLAKRQAAEIKQIAEFQQHLIAQVDAAPAGHRLRKDLIARFDAALRRAGVAGDSRASRIQSLRSDLELLNATAATAALIDETILQPGIAAVDAQFKDQPAVDAALRQTLADAYSRLGLYEKALPLQQTAVELRRKVLGNQDPHTVVSIYCLGMLLERLDRLNDAEVCVREAYEHYHSTAGPDDPETLIAEVQLAHIHYYRNDRGPEMEEKLRALLPRAKRILGEHNSVTLSCLGLLAEQLDQTGQWAEAEPYYRAVLDQRRLLGDGDLAAVEAANNLGAALQRHGRKDEAEPLLKEASERGREIQGDDHPETILRDNNYAIILRDLGRKDEALAFRRELCSRRLRVLGLDHSGTLDSQRKLGLLLFEQGLNDEAEAILRDALPNHRRALGPSDPGTIECLNNLVAVLMAKGRLDEAERYQKEAWERARDTLGPDHPSTITNLNNLAGIYLRQNRLSESKPLAREALELARQKWGNDDPRTVTSVWNVGFQLILDGRPAEAEPYLRELLETRARLLGADHPETIFAAFSLGGVLLDLGKLDDAAVYVQDTADRRRRLLSEASPDRLAGENLLGRLLTAQGKLAEAESCLRNALKTAESALGADDLTTLRCADGLGVVLYLQKQFDGAETLLRRAATGMARIMGDRKWSPIRARLYLGLALRDQERFAASEEQLLLADSSTTGALGVTPEAREQIRAAIVALYEMWDRKEPGQGYGDKATMWKEKQAESAAETQPNQR